MTNFGWGPFSLLTSFYNFQRLIHLCRLSLYYLACLVAGKMIALQECSYRNDKRLHVAIISEKKKAANNVSVLGAFSPSFPLISFRFLSVRLVTSPPEAKAPYCPFLKSLFLLWIPTILTLYINTTLVVPLFS